MCPIKGSVSGQDSAAREEPLPGWLGVGACCRGIHPVQQFLREPGAIPREQPGGGSPAAFPGGPEGWEPPWGSVHHQLEVWRGWEFRAPGAAQGHFHLWEPPWHPPAGGMWRGQRWLPMETSGFAPNAELKPFPGRLLPLHAHSAPWEANNYLPSVPLNKESEKKQRFRTSRAAYHFLQSRAGFWRVIRLQVTDSRACDEIPSAKTSCLKKAPAEPTNSSS